MIDRKYKLDERSWMKDAHHEKVMLVNFAIYQRKSDCLDPVYIRNVAFGKTGGRLKQNQ